MCERSGKRGCCIVYVRKLSFMPEKRASPRLNIRHVKPAVSSSIGEEEGISRGRFSIRKFRTQDCLKRYFIIWIPGKNYFWTFYLSPNYEIAIAKITNEQRRNVLETAGSTWPIFKRGLAHFSRIKGASLHRQLLDQNDDIWRRLKFYLLWKITSTYNEWELPKFRHYMLYLGYWADFA